MYADQTFYTDVYFGKVIPAAELDSFLSQASDAIDHLTFYRIGDKGGIDSLSAFRQKQIKLAVCVQADYMYGTQEMPEWVQSYSVGSVSVSKKDNISTRYSQQSLDYLKPTGLTYRGLGS